MGSLSLFMLKFKTKVGARGQIVIPKVIREHLGIAENKTLLLEVEEKSLRISPARGNDILTSWTEIAKREGSNVTKNYTYGDKLYEDMF